MPHHLSVTELCERWACKRELVYELIRTHQLPAINIAASEKARPLFRVRESDVVAFEAGREVRQPTPRKKPRRVSEKITEFIK